MALISSHIYKGYNNFDKNAIIKTQLIKLFLASIYLDVPKINIT